MGSGQCCIITLLHINRLNKTKSAIFIFSMCSLLTQIFMQDLFSPIRCILKFYQLDIICPKDTDVPAQCVE